MQVSLKTVSQMTPEQAEKWNFTNTTLASLLKKCFPDVMRCKYEVTTSDYERVRVYLNTSKWFKVIVTDLDIAHITIVILNELIFRKD